MRKTFRKDREKNAKGDTERREARWKFGEVTKKEMRTAISDV